MRKPLLWTQNNSKHLHGDALGVLEPHEERALGVELPALVEVARLVQRAQLGFSALAQLLDPGKGRIVRGADEPGSSG